MVKQLGSNYYWWAKIYKNFKLALGSIRLSCSDYTREIYLFLGKFEERFLYRNIVNNEELEELHRYTDNVVLKYGKGTIGINKDVC